MYMYRLFFNGKSIIQSGSQKIDIFYVMINNSSKWYLGTLSTDDECDDDDE